MADASRAERDNRPHGLVEWRSRGATLVAQIALIAALYAIGGWFGLQLTVPPGYASAFWAPAGIALASALLLGYRIWPGILFGSFAVNCWVVPEVLSAGDAAQVALAAFLIALGATLQACGTAWLLRRYRLFPARLETGRAVVKFLLLAGPAGCLINATLGPLVLFALGTLSAEALLFNTWNWWVGDTIGVTIVTPIALVWTARAGSIWRGRRTLVTAPMLLAMAAVVASFVVTGASDRARLSAELGEHATAFATSVGASLQRTVDAVDSVRSFYRGSTYVSREEFRVFTERVLSAHREIAALSWNPVVPHERVPRYLEEAHAAGLSEYRLLERDPDGRLVAASTRPDYIVVHYIEPLASNRFALGFDVSSDPVRRRALEQARDSGGSAATARVRLLQSDRSVAGILLFAPVYADNTPASVGERRTQLSGYVAGVVEVDAVMAPAFARLRDLGLGASIRDTTEGRAARLDNGKLGAVEAPLLSETRSVHFAGRRWALQIDAGTTFVARYRSPAAWFVLAAGLALTAMLEAFMLLLAGYGYLDRMRNVRLEKEIHRRRRFEAALHEEKERAEVTLQSIADGVISADAEGRVTFINRIGEALTGWSEGRALCAPLRDVLQLRRNQEGSSVEHLLDPLGSPGLEDDVTLLGRNGEEYGIRYSVSPIVGSTGEPLGTVVAFQDITEARRMAKEVAHRATHDALTGLVNRAEFERRLERVLRRERGPEAGHVVFFMDLDQFKIVNDTAGHSAGDQLLREVSTLLRAEIRTRDTLARLGGDEFGMLLENCPLERGAAIARSCVSRLRDFRFAWDGEVFRIGVSIGVVEIEPSTDSLASVMTRADVACYTAKDLGRNRVHVSSGHEQSSQARHLDIRRVADLRRAIDEDRLLLHAQPIVSLDEDHAPRYELLLRYRDASGNILPPAGLIRAAERYGIMAEIDQWVVKHALSIYRTAFDPGTRVAINLSGNSLDREGLAEEVIELLDQLSVPPEVICFEITETAAIRSLDTAIRFMDALRARGCEFALDDFGSGVSSFSYLRSLPVNYLKIDGDLVRDIATDPLARGIVEAIHGIARSFGLLTIAEHVSHDRILSALGEIGVDYAQGFALGRPARINVERRRDEEDRAKPTGPATPLTRSA